MLQTKIYVSMLGTLSITWNGQSITEKDSRSRKTWLLLAYLLHERSIPETSEALIIHRTTRSYRLKKLKDLMTANLDNEDVRLYLLFSFRLLES